jgi:HK97 family phage major capsid protein
MDPIQSAALRRASDALALAARPSRRGPQFSFARMLDRMSDGSLDGFEAETLQEVAGAKYDKYRVIIPFSLLTRDLSTAASGGGYLVNTVGLDPADSLRPWSVTARAGVTLLPSLTGNALLPLTTGNVTVTWLADETSPITATQPTIGQVAIAPKTAASLVTFSRQLSLQSFAENYVKRELLRTIGTAIDQSVLSGSGASGQPLGVLNTLGIGSQSGTSLAYAGVTAMRQAVAEANGDDASIAFIATPAIRKLLENRERATGSGYIWDNDRVASRPGYVTTECPTAKAVCGDWQHIIFATWGPGFEFMANFCDPTGFRTGTIQARAMLTCDVAVVRAAAFVAASSIT